MTSKKSFSKNGSKLRQFPIQNSIATSSCAESVSGNGSQLVCQATARAVSGAWSVMEERVENGFFASSLEESRGNFFEEQLEFISLSEAIKPYEMS